MWAEVATAGGIVGLIGLIARMQNTKTKENSTRIDEKTDEKMCDQRYGEVMSRLGRGVERFDKIDTKLDEHHKMAVAQGELLARIDTKLDLLNGKGKKKT